MAEPEAGEEAAGGPEERVLAVGPMPEEGDGAAPRKIELADVPVAMRSCVACHRQAVARFLDHGMARSVGPLREPPVGTVENPGTGHRYELAARGGEGWLNATLEDGGIRVQRLVGRIGAGLLDTSWVGAEVGVTDGEPTGRLFFAPVETIAGHGHELSPFELSDQPAGLDMALEEGCLTCHTESRLERLPGAAVGGAGEHRQVFPPNALGEDAFEHLSAFTCDTCHGDSELHAELMVGLDDVGLTGEIAIPRFGERPAAEQRDVCARCHLQGDARLDLVRARPGRRRPLAGQIPVLVPAEPGDDFRFVSQIERLALSACFRGSREMTCSTCHDPHAGVRAQGTASFNAACATCHVECSRAPQLSVEEVTGEPARSEEGCIDCHLRSSQPFDLPHVRSADHNIRRHIPLPQDDIPHRQFADPEGPLEIYDDGRLAAAFETPGGRRWKSGVLAMGLMTLGRVDEAAAEFARFPAPGSPAAREPSVPRDLVPLETVPAFHQLRALSLMATGKFPAAIAAYGDALELDPFLAGARLGRARLRFDLGDVGGALEDSQVVIDAYPEAEQPWDFRASTAERLRRPDLAAQAFEESVKRWPSNASVWYRLGLLRRQGGDEPGAREALERARVLSPSFSLPGATAR